MGKGKENMRDAQMTTPNDYFDVSEGVLWGRWTTYICTKKPASEGGDGVVSEPF